MNPEADDELLSAYLDDELSVEERARVEQMLAEQPDSRQLLEELQALKATLGDLPRDRLDPDFAGQVMQQAQREASSLQPTPDPDVAGRDRLRRPLAYAVLVAAAAALIMLFFPDPPPQVALNDPRHDRGAEARVEDRNSLDGAFREEADNGQLPESPQIAAPRADDSYGLGTAKKATGGGELPQPARAFSAGRDVAGTTVNAADVDGELVADPAPAENAAADGQPDPTTWAALQLAEIGQQATEDHGLLVVMCEVSPEAVHQRTFEQVLAGQQIAVENETVRTLEEQSNASYRFSVAASDPAGQVDQPAEVQLQRQAVAGLAQADDAQVVDLVYVEADPALLQATLTELSARRDRFLHVAVESTGGVEPDRHLSLYSYGEGQSAGRVDRANKYFVQQLVRSSAEGDGDTQKEQEKLAKSSPAQDAAPLDAAESLATDLAAERGGFAGGGAGQSGARAETASEPTSTVTAGATVARRARAVRIHPNSADRSGQQEVAERVDRLESAPVASGPESKLGQTARSRRGTEDEELRQLAISPAPETLERTRLSYRRALFVFKLPASSHDAARPAASAPTPER